MAVNLLRYVAEQDSQTELLVLRLKEVWSDVGLLDLGIPSDSAEVRSILEPSGSSGFRLRLKIGVQDLGSALPSQIAPNVMDRLAP